MKWFLLCAGVMALTCGFLSGAARATPPTLTSDNDEFIPPGSEYENPAGSSVTVSGGLGPGQTITRFHVNTNISASGFTMPPLTVTTDDSTFTGEADLTINGTDYTGDVTGTATITGPGSGGTYDAEMTQLDVSGGTLPAGEMLRESPTLTSSGETTYTPIGGGDFHISSFFDVFTELSLDGGATWTPASASLEMDMTNLPEPGCLTVVAAAGFGLLRRRRSAC